MPPPRRAYNKDNPSNRSSYSPTNAEQFRCVFDEMIANGKSREIHSSVVGLRISTLYIKANDALKWLAECDLKKGVEYALLRSKITISKTDYGIFLYFKPSISHINSAPADSSKGWKQDLLAWIQTAQDMDVFKKENIMLSEEDREWLTRIAHDLGPQTELALESNGFRMMR